MFGNICSIDVYFYAYICIINFDSTICIEFIALIITNLQEERFTYWRLKIIHSDFNI